MQSSEPHEQENFDAKHLEKPECPSGKDTKRDVKHRIWWYIGSAILLITTFALIGGGYLARKQRITRDRCFTRPGTPKMHSMLLLGNRMGMCFTELIILSLVGKTFLVKQFGNKEFKGSCKVSANLWMFYFFLNSQLQQ